MKTFQVGGAVRDKILGKEPNDYDYVVVGSFPAEMESLGFKQVGKDFPVYLHPTTGEEYALARTERKSGLKHTDFETVFDSSITIEEDLARRDLTINAIAMDVDTGEFIDPYKGMQDIQNKVLRHTSEAFKEDPLRILRLARFSARFPDFTIANDTYWMVRQMVKAGELDHISQDRIWVETKKAFLYTNPLNYFELLSRIGALPYVCNNPKATFFDEKFLTRIFNSTINFDDDHKLLVRAAAFFSYYWYDISDEKKFVEVMVSAKAPSNVITLATFMGKFGEMLGYKMRQISSTSEMVELLDKMNIKGMVAKNPNFLDDIFLITKAWSLIDLTPADGGDDSIKIVMEAYLDTKEFLSCMVKRHKWEHNTEPTGEDYKEMLAKIKFANVDAAMDRYVEGLVLMFGGYEFKNKGN